MAAKKSTRRKTGVVRPGDTEKVKKAFTRMMDAYISMKEDQRKFEAAAGDLISIIWPWSIPFETVKNWRKGLRRG